MKGMGGDLEAKGHETIKPAHEGVCHGQLHDFVREAEEVRGEEVEAIPCHEKVREQVHEVHKHLKVLGALSHQALHRIGARLDRLFLSASALLVGRKNIDARFSYAKILHAFMAC